MTTPSNQELAVQIKEVDKRSARRHKSMLASFSSFKIEMREAIMPMHDFITDYNGFERGKATLKKDGTININKDVWQLIIKLVVIIGALVGITQITK